MADNVNEKRKKRKKYKRKHCQTIQIDKVNYV